LTREFRRWFLILPSSHSPPRGAAGRGVRHPAGRDQGLFLRRTLPHPHWGGGGGLSTPAISWEPASSLFFQPAAFLVAGGSAPPSPQPRAWKVLAGIIEGVAVATGNVWPSASVPDPRSGRLAIGSGQTDALGWGLWANHFGLGVRSQPTSLPNLSIEQDPNPLIFYEVR